MNFKQTSLLLIGLFFLITSLRAQVTHPDPYPLANGPYVFSSLPSGTITQYPPSIQGWGGPLTVVLPADEVPGNVQATVDEPLLSDTTPNLLSSFRNEGSDYGISIYSDNVSPAGRPAYPMALVAGMNTMGMKNITFSWTASNVFIPDLNAGIQLQYRVGTSGNWTNLPDQRFASSTPNSTLLYVTFKGTLPAEADNKPVVQLRWFYFLEQDETPFGNWGVRIGLLDIGVFGEYITPKATSPDPYRLVNANYSFNGLPVNTTTQYPASMLGWGGKRIIIAGNGVAPITEQPNYNVPLDTGSTPANSNPKVSINNNGANGISLRTEYVATKLPQSLVITVDTRKCSKISVEWAAKTLFAYTDGARAGIQTQWRPDTTGNWTNITAHKYTSTNPNAPATAFAADTLPAGAENKANMQIRWLYYTALPDNNAVTSADRIAVDQIAIKAKTRTALSAPLADFAFNSTGNPVVAFSDQSTNIPHFWSWNFGDGATSALQHPSHTYTSNGTFNVKLKVTNSAGSDSITKVVTVSGVIAAPEANFGHTATGLQVNYTDESTNSPSTWEWTFGDGNTSSIQNPSHTYAAAGTYAVRLIASNATGTDTITKDITVTESVIKPSADFTYQVSALAVDFEDESTNSPVGWEWNFGDNGTSTDQHPSHNYAAPGTYNVRLIATNSAGSDTIIKMITANAAVIKPEADFDYIATALTAVFEDQSANAPSAWEWTFGDGATSTDQDPFHTYSTAGTYTVRLIASNVAGSDTVTKDVTVTENVMIPEAAYSFVEDNRIVDFTDESTNSPTTWKWDFGDGATSTLKDPQHTYTKDSTYSVCLIATNSAGSDTICQDVITLADAVASIDHSSIRIYPNPSAGIISIDLRTALTGEATLRVINILGEVVKALTIKENTIQLDMQDIKAGAYMLVLDIDHQRFVSRVQIIR